MNDEDRNDSPISEEERIEKEAADWVACFDRGLSAAEQDAFFEWLAENPRHGEVFAEDQQEWQDFDLLDEWRPEYSQEANPDLLKRNFPKPFWKRAASLYGLAAMLVLGVGLGMVYQWRSSLPEANLAEGEFATSYERHVLSDGSTVELNAGAQVAVHFTAAERRVQLVTGEAHFSIIEDSERPFVVGVEGAEVRAIGTAFSIRLTSESFEVLVTEGKVRMEEIGGAKAEDFPATEHALSVPTDLIAGQMAVQPLNNDVFEPIVYTVTMSELESRLAWKDEILDYDSRSLVEVVNEFNQHNYTQIRIGDEELNDIKVTIALKPDNFEGFVKLLELSAGIEAEYAENGTIILKKR